MSDVRIVFVMLKKPTYNVSRDRFGGGRRTEGPCSVPCTTVIQSRAFLTWARARASLDDFLGAHRRVGRGW